MDKKNNIKKKIFASIFMVLMILMSLSGCIGGEEETPTTTEAPKRERVLTYTFWEVMATWDPAMTFDSTNAMAGECYETLTFFDQETDPMLQPKLATSWEQSEDELTWTFHLREDVKFHTGREMTAEDVKYSIDRTMEMNKGAAWIWIGLKSVEVADEYTVKFHTEYPMNIPLIASSTYGAYIIDSEEVKSHGDTYEAQTEWFQKGNECGTGPYYVHEWTETQQTVFKKFDDYWKGWDGKRFDTCIMKYVTEGSTLIQMLEGGDAQIIHEPPIDLISRLERNEEVAVQGFPSYWNMVNQLNCKKSPTDELAVRKALSYSWDYEGICDDIWEGYATPAKGPVPKGVWGRPEDLPTYSFDPNKAKQILEDAGWKDSDGDGIREKDGEKLQIEITCFENETYRKAAETWHSTLTEIGVDAELRITPFDTGWSRAKNFETSPHVFMLDWWPTYITPFDMLYSMFHSSQIGAFNCAYYENEEFDELVMEANEYEGTNIEKSAELYGKAQELLIEDAAAVYAWDRQDIFAYNKNRVTGLNPNAAYPMVMFLYELSYIE